MNKPEQWIVIHDSDAYGPFATEAAADEYNADYGYVLPLLPPESTDDALPA